MHWGQMAMILSLNVTKLRHLKTVEVKSWLGSTRHTAPLEEQCLTEELVYQARLQLNGGYF